MEMKSAVIRVEIPLDLFDKDKSAAAILFYENLIKGADKFVKEEFGETAQKIAKGRMERYGNGNR